MKTNNIRYSALVVAAGKGLRAGLGYNKVLFYMQKHQNTILGKTLDFFNNDERCQQIIVACSQADFKKSKKNTKAIRLNMY